MNYDEIYKTLREAGYMTRDQCDDVAQLTVRWLKEKDAEIERLRAQIDAKHVDCSTCANRCRVHGASQETHCDMCIWHERWRKDYYVSREDLK